MTEARSGDGREWFSVEDADGTTWLFDVTFLGSNWTCIWGQGCLGVEPEPAEETQRGCCSHGAHFSDDADRHRVEHAIGQLDATHWHNHDHQGASNPVVVDEEGADMTAVVDGACIFHNPVGFDGGAGCALHRAAYARGERPMDWKPEVCWQLPLRLETQEDDNGFMTHTLREWKRRDWGGGGGEFHWWCTDDDRAFVGAVAVYEELRSEITALVGERHYGSLVEHLAHRRPEQLLPHPALRVNR